MRITTKVLLGGLACALVIVAGGLLYSDRINNRRDALIAECKAKPDPWQQFEHAPGPPPGYVIDPLVCDPYELLSIGANEGLQGRIVDAHYAALAADEVPWFWAGVVAVLAAIPWAWYFLLRRLSEVRAALAGNSPDR